MALDNLATLAALLQALVWHVKFDEGDACRSTDLRWGST
jgi:hypothetical protein